MARPQQLVASTVISASPRAVDGEFGGFAVGVGGFVELEGPHRSGARPGFVILGGPAGVEAEA